MTEPLAVRVLRQKLASNDGHISIQQETATAVLAEIDRLRERVEAFEAVARPFDRVFAPGAKIDPMSNAVRNLLCVLQGSPPRHGSVRRRS